MTTSMYHGILQCETFQNVMQIKRTKFASKMKILSSYTSKGTDLGQHRVLDEAADTFIAEQLQLVGFNPRVSDEGDGGGAAL